MSNNEIPELILEHKILRIGKLNYARWMDWGGTMDDAENSLKVQSHEQVRNARDEDDICVCIFCYCYNKFMAHLIQ